MAENVKNLNEEELRSRANELLVELKDILNQLNLFSQNSENVDEEYLLTGKPSEIQLAKILLDIQNSKFSFNDKLKDELGLK